jgi:hypothetical protein
LAFFPGMSLTSEKKLSVLSRVLELLSQQFTVLPVGQHAQLISSSRRLPIVEPAPRPVTEIPVRF